VIDTATNEAAPLPIEVGTTPIAIAITPDGKTAYVVNEASKSVSVIDTATNAVASVPLGAGEVPAAIAITPDGRTAYVANEGSDNVSVIDTATNHVASTAIAVGVGPGGMAITADGHSAYVANNGANSVSVIDTATNVAPAATIPVGKGPVAIAIIPDQAPVASFSSPHEARLGAPVSFDASASKDPDGSIAGFVWDFGDGTKASTAGPAFSHAFARPGTFKVTLTATDNEGCPNKLIFTGQTSSCNGPVSPPEAPAVKVVYPTVRLTCPRSAKPRGCGFTLQAVTKKRRGKAETRVTRVKVKAGKSVQAPLKPQPKFVTKLGVAKRVLVKETLTVGGSRRTSFKQLRLR
jgi:YVTN family beta-propeller protein